MGLSLEERSERIDEVFRWKESGWEASMYPTDGACKTKSGTKRGNNGKKGGGSSAE